MSLLKSIEEDKKLLSEENEAEEKEAKEKEETVEEPTVENEEKEDSEPKEEVKEEEKEGPKEDASSAAFAKMRRDLAAANKKQRELEDALKEKEQPEEKQEHPEQEILQLLNEKRARDAERALVAMEESFKKNVPDYEDVANQYKTDIFKAIKIQNPRASHQDCLEMTRQEILLRSSRYFNQGLDPIQELYEDAKSLGYKSVPKEDKKEEKSEKKYNLDTVAKNKARSAGTAAASGRSGAALTGAAALDMPLSEFSKISPDELAKIEKGE